MIPVKVQCACGQRYSFDVEPVNGRMPAPVACPVCGADGTATANSLLAQTLGTPAAAAARATATAPTTAATPAATPTRPLFQRESAADKWKWWYYVLAGIMIGAYSIWQAYDKHSIKPLGELILAVFCILVGIWSFNSKRKKRLPQP